MTKFVKRSALIGALVAIYFSFPAASNAAPPDKSAGLFPDPIVAKGKGLEIKHSQIEEAFIAVKARAAAGGQTLPEAQRQKIEAELLEQLIITQLLKNKATADDKTKAKETTDKLIDKAKKEAISEDAFNARIKASGMTFDQIRDQTIEQNMCELVVERELKSKLVIRDAAIKKFYDENPTKFEQPEKVRASHILISTLDKATQEPLPADQKREKEKLIRGLKARAEKGEDFAKLAKEFSEDPGSKDKGGEYTFGRGSMVKEFEAAAFSLKTNQVSDVVETQYGYHIIKLSEKLPSTKMEFAKASSDIKDYLVREAFQKELPAYKEKLKKDANVEIITPKEKAK